LNLARSKKSNLVVDFVKFFSVPEDLAKFIYANPDLNNDQIGEFFGGEKQYNV